MINEENATKNVYTYDCQLFTLDHTDRSPISGDWQIPAGMTEIEPPEEKDGFHRVFNGESWDYIEIPAEPAHEEPTYEPDQLAELNIEFETAKAELIKYLQTAQLAGDEETISELQEEYADLLIAYEEALEELEG